MSIRSIDISAYQLCTERPFCREAYKITSFFGLIPCVSCGKYVSTICDTCSEKLLYFVPNCPYCSRFSENGKSHQICQTSFLTYTYSISCYCYTKVIKSLFSLYKYERAFQYQRVLEALLNRYVLGDPFLLFRFLDRLVSGKRVVLLPVPMSRRKQRDRGFSPALELAVMLGRILKRSQKTTVSIMPALVNKIAETPAQAKKKRRERLISVQRAYELNEDEVAFFVQLKPDILFIVDDVVTTGATTNVVIEKLQTNSSLKNYLATIPIIRFTFAAA